METLQSDRIRETGKDMLRGLFPISARLQHSCVPYVKWAYNPVLNKLTVQAVRDIQAGEAITVAFIETSESTRV